MTRSGHGIVRIYKQKLFPKLFGFIKELLNEVRMIHEEMFHFGCRLEKGRLMLKLHVPVDTILKGCPL